MVVIVIIMVVIVTMKVVIVIIMHGDFSHTHVYDDDGGGDCLIYN